MKPTPTKLGFALAILSAAVGSWAQGINVVVNGQPLTLANDVPRMVGGRVFVPIRGVLENLGVAVQWDASSQTLTAVKGETVVRLSAGSNVAYRNNQPVNLDAPAYIYRGTTLVPLRFLSEAFGAYVKWDAVTQTVLITTPVTDAATSVTPTSQGAATAPQVSQREAIGKPTLIGAFFSNETGFKGAGSQLTFTLQGRAGGVATFRIPGATDEIPMREAFHGVYTGTWTAPQGGDNGINLIKAVAIGTLRVGDLQQSMEASNTLTIDTAPPAVLGITPDTSGAFAGARPFISAVLDDGSGTGVNPAGVQLRVDGRDVTTDAIVTASRISYRPAEPLAPGNHDVTVVARDKADNITTRAWTFVVAVQPNVIQSFTYAGSPNAEPGSTMTFTLIAEPGGTVTFSIGEKRINYPMTETSPGTYVGTYTVRKNDFFSQEVVTALFKSRSGQSFSAQAGELVGVNGATVETPSIASPIAEATVQSPLIVKGAAMPYGRVHVRVEYNTILADATHFSGPIGDFIAIADQDGSFETLPIDLSGRVMGQSTVYVITAYVEGPTGVNSAIATVIAKG